jgi:hypothetical protein
LELELPRLLAIFTDRSLVSFPTQAISQRFFFFFRENKSLERPWTASALQALCQPTEFPQGLARTLERCTLVVHLPTPLRALRRCKKMEIRKLQWLEKAVAFFPVGTSHLISSFHTIRTRHGIA